MGKPQRGYIMPGVKYTKWHNRHPIAMLGIVALIATIQPVSTVFRILGILLLIIWAIICLYAWVVVGWQAMLGLASHQNSKISFSFYAVIIIIVLVLIIKFLP